VKQASFSARIDKRVGCHTFRHSFATHLLQKHYDYRSITTFAPYKNCSVTKM
jgi:site-specific recombinase XerD